MKPNDRSTEGYSNNIFNFELDSRAITKVAKMFTGRDLRNKIVCFNEEVFTVGGTKACSAEKYNLGTKRWTGLKDYSTLVKDTLDSWYSALIFENPIKLTNSQSTMFQICDKLSAYENRTLVQAAYDDDYHYDTFSDEIEPNNYIPPAHHLPLHRPHRLDNFEYDEEISVSNGGMSFDEDDEEEDHSLLHS